MKIFLKIRFYQNLLNFLFQILYSEQKHDSQEDNSADREVTSTFNPEAQCFRPIEIVGASLNGLTLSPKGSPNDSSSTSSTSPMYKNSSPSGMAPSHSNGSSTFLGRQQEPIQFTTATFAQTKFGSTKLKNNSKRTNRFVNIFFLLKYCLFCDKIRAKYNNE